MIAPLDPHRHAMIKRAVVALGERNETSLALWTRMTTELAKIIGEAGFESLFFRNLYQIKAHHPWLLVSGNASAKSMEHLAACLATRENAESEEVSTALLINFTDTLNLLIGELITNRILLAAWGTLAVDAVPEQSK